MKKNFKMVPVLIVITGILLISSCSDNKLNRPWKISEETIRDIVKAKLECNEINVVVDNIGAPQTTCDQLGDCTDYADVRLAIEGLCKGRAIKLSGVFRLYKSKPGNYRAETIEGAE